MKKKMLVPLLFLCLATCLFGCGSGKEGTTEVKTRSIFERVEDDGETKAPDTKPEVQLPDGVEFNSADGFYYGYLQSSGQDKIGAANEDGVLYTIIYKAEILGDNLIIYGNFGYKNFQDQDTVSVSDKGIYSFTVTDDTTFQMAGGDQGPETVSKEEFQGYLNDLIDSQLYFEVEISETSAKTVTISA